jgi:hypothetical protein
LSKLFDIHLKLKFCHFNSKISLWICPKYVSFHFFPSNQPGSSVCWFPDGACTDGESIIALDENAESEKSPMKGHGGYYNFVYHDYEVHSFEPKCERISF